MKKDLLITGKCGSTFGLNGAVRLITDNTIDNLKKPSELVLRKNGSEFYLKVDNIWKKGSNTYITFVGIETPEEASKVLTNAEIFIDRKYASPLDEGCVYCSDLVGLDVVNDGCVVGEVVSWLDACGNIMLEIMTKDSKKHIVPYQKVFFSSPDLKKKSIEILNRDVLI